MVERRLYEVWMGAFHRYGESYTPSLLGQAYAYSFKEACILVLSERSDFDPELLTFQEVPLYDDYMDAKKRIWKRQWNKNSTDE
tara:strand:- start:1209 stop:1460 length:252 start_codon:yes stop_codon:yes gene_type:complete